MGVQNSRLFIFGKIQKSRLFLDVQKSRLFSDVLKSRLSRLVAVHAKMFVGQLDKIMSRLLRVDNIANAAKNWSVEAVTKASF